MIRHTVVFSLKHAQNSAEEAIFLERARKLANIATVKKFECLKQVSSKNEFDFGLSMEFDHQADYDFYNDHPEHVEFVTNCWLKEVKNFMEIDYVEL